jgi:hypothetical protein
MNWSVKMIERWPSLDRGIATIARVEKKRTIGWEDAGYVVFSAGGTLCRRVDSLELLESDLAGMNSTYQFLGELVDLSALVLKGLVYFFWLWQ